MRVCYLHQYFLADKEAGAARSFSFVRRLADRGHQVTVITGGINYMTGKVHPSVKGKLMSRTFADGFTICRINPVLPHKKNYFLRALGFLTFSLGAVPAGLLSGKHDVVFATSTPLTIGIPGWFLSRAWRVPFVFDLRDIWPEFAVAFGVLKRGLIVNLAGKLEKFLYRAAHKLTTVSEGLRTFLISKGVAPEKIEVLRHGADCELFIPGEGREAIRHKYGWEGKFVCLYLGAHGKVNSLDTLVDAAEILRDDEKIVLPFLGDGKLRDLYIGRAQEKGLKNTVFIPSVPLTEVPQYLAAADLFLISTRYTPITGYPCYNKFYDYLAAGRPIIVNFEGEMQRMLEESDAGAGIEPESPEAFAEIIRELASKPEKVLEMGKNARKLAEIDMNRNDAADKFVKVLENAVQK
ncbi:glycosyltransferase family 4 protein [Candidatus Hydrogenedentota bacterium]